MTTPEQLLVDRSWRWRHSVYTLWALFFGFGFVSLLYTGIRAKKSSWISWGVAYGVIVITAFTVGGSLSPDDPDSPTPLGASLAYTVLMIVWVVSAAHVFRVRKDWLRWKAAAAGQPQWYEAPATTSTEADLSRIGMDDPTTEYLAPPSATPPTASSGQRLPPPPVAPPPHAKRVVPPPPTSAPAAGAIWAAEGSATEGPSTGPLDLNSATVSEIAALPGLGVATATRLVNERERRGGFDSVDEAALAAAVQPHVRSRLQQLAFVAGRERPQRRRTSGRIVDI